jgi:FMN reductase
MGGAWWRHTNREILLSRTIAVTTNRAIARTTNSARPLVVGIGGTLRDGSVSQCALSIALDTARIAGARTVLFTGAELLDLPMYGSRPSADFPETVSQLVDALRSCDGVIVASPGYHGGVSGLVKNALDYAEELREDTRPYFEGRAMGCIAVGSGWQGAVTTLANLRSIAHALRAWPTPVGSAVNSLACSFSDGRCSDQHVQAQLEAIGRSVVSFARRSRAEFGAELPVVMAESPQVSNTL